MQIMTIFLHKFCDSVLIVLSSDDLMRHLTNFENHLFVEIPYQVTIYTGDEKGAGTDSELKMTLFGEQGKSEEIALEKDEER